MFARLDLPERLVDEPLVVFLRQVPLDQLRGDLHGEIRGLVPDLLEGARGLQLNLPLGVPDDRLGLRLRPLLRSLAQPLGSRS